MRIEPIGDAAFVARDLGDVPAYILADAVQRLALPGVIEVVPSYDTLGIYVDPVRFEADTFVSKAGSIRAEGEQPGRLHTVPVCYDLGEDLEGCCDELGLTQNEFVAQHAGREYLCYAVGFAPGFPYLGYLPVRICGLSRLPAPRIAVPAGAVGVAEDQTGIYPGNRPGGWRLVGATPLTTVDVAEGYFPISAGDRIVFEPISLAEYEARKGERL
jgi:inhibitor of KinA